MYGALERSVFTSIESPQCQLKSKDEQPPELAPPPPELNDLLEDHPLEPVKSDTVEPLGKPFIQFYFNKYYNIIIGKSTIV